MICPKTYGVSLTELHYLLDLFKEIKGGVDDGVEYEIEQAIDMINAWAVELEKEEEVDIEKE